MMLSAQKLSNPTRSVRSQQRRVAVQTKAAPSGMDVLGDMRPTTPKAWEMMSDALKKAGTKVLTADAVLSLQAKGTPIIDIRPYEEYAKGHIDGSVNVPLYQLIAGWSPQQFIRRAGFAFFGIVNGTEANPNFAEQIREAVPKGKGAVLVCQVGGTLTENAASKAGRQSRSLIAAYALLQLGYSNLAVLEGGINQWVRDGRDVFEINN